MKQMCNVCGDIFVTDFIQPSGKCWECYKELKEEGVEK